MRIYENIIYNIYYVLCIMYYVLCIMYYVLCNILRYERENILTICKITI